MISRIFTSTLNVVFQPRQFSLSNNYLFCTNNTSTREFNPLRNKIMDLSSFEAFTDFFNNKKDQFDASCYATASRTLAKILIDQKPVFYAQHRDLIKRFLEQLSNINFDNINHSQLSNALYLLRILKNDSNNNNFFMLSLMKTIISKSQNKIKQLQTDTSTNRLSYYYQELSTLRMKNTWLIIKRLLQILQKNQNNNQVQTLSISDITMILKGMKIRQYFNYDQTKLLRIIVDTVIDKYIANISFFELCQISVGLNQVVQRFSDDIRNRQLTEKIQQIHKKVLSNIDEMDQKSIMYILSSIKTKNQTYNKIYRTIFEKIFEQISQNGQSSFNEMFTLRLFNGISNKVGLYNTTEVNQEKFFMFLKNTLTKTPRYCNTFLEQYISKDFFSHKQLNRVVQIVELLKGQFFPRLSLMYELTSRNINVQKIMNLQKANLQVKEKYLLTQTYIYDYQSRKSNQNQQKYQQVVRKLKQRFITLYKAQDNTFNKLIDNLDSKYLPLLRLFFKQIQENLPNPFQTQQSFYYKKNWLKCYLYSLNEYQFVRSQNNLLKDKITLQDIQVLLKSLMHQQIKNKNYITNTLSLLTKNIQLFSNKRDNLQLVEKFLTNIFNVIYQQNTWQLARSKYWFVLNQLLEKNSIEIFLSCFTSLIRKILRSQTPQTYYSQRYILLLEKLIRNSEKISSKGLINQIMSQAFRLNMVTRQLATVLPSSVRQSLKPTQKLHLQMIQKNQFVLQGIQLKKQNLKLFLSNPCAQVYEIIKNNQQQIKKMIQQMKFNQIWNCISNYRLGNRKYSVAVLQELFGSFNNFYITFDKYNPSFVASILRKNHLLTVQYKTDNIKAYYKKALQYYSLQKNINKLTYQNHIILIKDANDFKIRNQQYLHNLLNNLSYQNVNMQKQLYYLILSLGFALKENQLNKLIKKDLYTNTYYSYGKSIQMFIWLQNQLKNPSEILKRLIQKFNESSQKTTQKMSIYALNYEYLKKKYPQQTKNWLPNNIEKADFFRSLEQYNENILFELRKIVQEVCQKKWEEKLIHNNYYYVFRNLAIIFPTVTKYYGENEGYKKIMKQLTGVQKVVVLDRKAQNLKSIIKYMVSSNEKVFTPQQEEKMFKRINQMYQSKRDKNTTQEVVDAEGVEGEKPKA